MTRIILAEDEVDLREGLEECLTLLGFETVGVGSALELFQKLATDSFDVAVIDVGLPDQSGFDIASVLTRRPEMGVVILTALGGTEDRIRGFASGADLYFVKPVDCRELGAAIHSLRRRLENGRAAPAAIAAAPSGGWVFDRTRWALRTSGNVEIDLTSAEITLLERLLQHPGETATRQELLAALGYEEDEAGNRNLEAIVRRLRRKIESVAGGKAPIQTVHSRGYLFSAPVAVVVA
ncbi:MAG: response regulator transcription factor [Magnetospirillum sp.]|nr:response regulator transcription factor [Magnetospirillum sp.]